jgi:hypothetical protein
MVIHMQITPGLQRSVLHHVCEDDEIARPARRTSAATVLKVNPLTASRLEAIKAHRFEDAIWLLMSVTAATMILLSFLSAARTSGHGTAQQKMQADEFAGGRSLLHNTNL